jgi:hypothetical protein
MLSDSDAVGADVELGSLTGDKQRMNFARFHEFEVVECSDFEVR